MIHRDWIQDLRIRSLEAGDEARWDAFVAACPESTFFHWVGWRRILEETFRHRCHYLIAERSDAMVGVLPLAEVRSRLFGHSLTSLPFCVYGGVATTEPTVRAALHKAAADLSERLGVDHLELRNLARHEPSWPEQGLYVTFRRPLAQDREANMLAIPRKQRAMVRKGIKNGLTAAIDANADRFFELYADNVQRHGTPALPRRYFDMLQAVFGTSCEVLTILGPGGDPVSSVMSFYFRDQVLPYYAGDLPAARDLAANDFKYWALMCQSADRGVRLFDYGRSRRGSGSFDFKRNWGFDPVPLHYEYRLGRDRDLPQNNPGNPRYRAMIAVWRRLPRSVANGLGPFIVRGLG